MSYKDSNVYWVCICSGNVLYKTAVLMNGMIEEEYNSKVESDLQFSDMGTDEFGIWLSFDHSVIRIDWLKHYDIIAQLEEEEVP